MSFKAEFSVGSLKLRILESRFHLNQETDITGRPSSVVRGGKATIRVEGSEKDSKALFAWMADSSKIEKKAVLTYFSRDSNDKKSREVEFTNAYCVGYSESYKADTDMPYTVEFTLSAEKITDKHAEMENVWPQG